MSDPLVPIIANSEYDNPNPDTLFISYARKDVEFAQKLNADLQRHGVTTWIDELGIRSGEDWPDRIAMAIEGCKAMLVILSPHSVASRWVRRELAFADTKGKRVLPLLYKPCGLPKWFELSFGNVQRADFSRGSYDTNLTELLASIQQVLGLTVATLAQEEIPVWLRILREEGLEEPSLEEVPTAEEVVAEAADVLTISSPIHLELVRVPAGEFLMGSDPVKDKDAEDDEQPQHRVYLSEFRIGKYPVTNAQYAAFVRATQHEAPEHWERGEVPSGKENNPAVYVSWHDAVAFCQWLSRETGKTFRLPTEAEWEKAARGTDGWIYPWGNEWDEAKLNSEEAGPGDTTPVGQYSPDGDSPYGAADMSGNVWEWCADWFNGEEYQHRAKSTVRDPQGPKEGASRVLRGGSFLNARSGVRCAVRSGFYPDLRSTLYGFRVVVVSPILSDL
jgi:formylglycine-generating enzyme required for sulfatase activity